MDKIEKQKIALLGGGQRCKAFLQVILSEDFDEKKPEILGVADINERDMALQYAQDKGIFTTSDVKDLFSIKDLNLILQLTRDDNLRAMVQDTKPPWILLVDHHEAQSLVDYY
ncbi:MAG: hypothetical protein WAU34_10705, partial [Desulfobacterales bacterium]